MPDPDRASYPSVIPDLIGDLDTFLIDKRITK